MKRKKLLASVFSTLLLLSSSTSVFADSLSTNVSVPESIVSESNIDASLVKEFKQALKDHQNDLILTDTETYKEIKLENGYTLFAQVTETPKESSNKSIGIAALQSNSITSRHGYKNLYGTVTVQLITTTDWTYDFNKVVSASTSVTAEPKGFGWQLHSSGVGLPFKGAYERYWEYTAFGIFQWNVAGVNFDTLELNTQHRVNYDGSYAWKYSVID